MQFKYDVEAIFDFIGDRKNHIYEGYRPAHMIQKKYLTTGVHSYYNIEDNTGEIRGMIGISLPGILSPLFVGWEENRDV